MPRNQFKGVNSHENPINTGKTYKTPIEHYLDNQNSRKHAIFAKCFDCCGGGLSTDDNSGVRKEIKFCPVTKCSLWNFRPYKNKIARKVSTLARAIDSFDTQEKKYDK
jgi:hypothetical protein